MRRSLVGLVLVAAGTVALAIAGVLAVLSGAVPCAIVDTQPACEVALVPGPAEDTLGLVEVDGARTYPSAGELLLTTVAVRRTSTSAAGGRRAGPRRSTSCPARPSTRASSSEGDRRRRTRC